MSIPITIQSTDEARASAPPTYRWLWPGYLATGMITLFTSRWKTGKTTLLSHLLAGLEKGGALAEEEVHPGKAVIVSEEPMGLWLERADRHGFGANVHWCCRPFPARPTMAQWENLILELAALNADVVAFDPLAMVLPRDVENNATALMTALDPLRLLTAVGTAVMILHHPRKSGPVGELNPRGSGALASTADILMQLDVPIGSSTTERCRRLTCASRLHESTSRMIELSEDGLEYRTIAETVHDSFEHGWVLMKTIFEDATTRLTRQEVHQCWPPDYDKPSLSTVTRWIDRALKENRIERKGKGRYRDPYEYALPGFKCPVEVPQPLPNQEEITRRWRERISRPPGWMGTPVEK